MGIPTARQGASKSAKILPRYLPLCFLQRRIQANFPFYRNSLSQPPRRHRQFSPRSMTEMPNAIPDSLLDRNATWSQEYVSNMPELASALSQGQHPKVFWIGCSDSRVPESVVCNARPGELFVLRNVANQFQTHDDSAVSALTFAVQGLGVEHVIVVGHTSCGGVSAAVKQVL